MTDSIFLRLCRYLACLKPLFVITQKKYFFVKNMKRISWFTNVETPNHCSQQRVKPAWTVTLDTHHCPPRQEKGADKVLWLAVKAFNRKLARWLCNISERKSQRFSVAALHTYISRKVCVCGVRIPRLWHRNQGLHYSEYEFFNNVMAPQMTLKLICQRGCQVQMGTKTAANTRNLKWSHTKPYTFLLNSSSITITAKCAVMSEKQHLKSSVSAIKEFSQGSYFTSAPSRSYVITYSILAEIKYSCVWHLQYHGSTQTLQCFNPILPVKTHVNRLCI